MKFSAFLQLSALRNYSAIDPARSGSRLAVATTYLQQNRSQKGALFFIRLKHTEGELAVGLGRRDFDATCEMMMRRSRTLLSVV